MPLPLTSGNSTTPEQMLNAGKLAAKEINANGGAGGREIVIHEYDDRLSADEAAKVAQRAITVDGAEVFIGAFSTIEGLAIRQMTDPRKILFLSPSTVAPALSDGSEYVFRTTHSQDDFPGLWADVAVQLGLKKVVVLHDDGPSGATMWEVTQDALAARGIDPGQAVGYPFNATDVSTAIAAVKAQDPDGVIIIAGSGADAGLDIKTMAEQGLTVPAIGFSSAVSEDSLRIGGAAFKEVPAYTVHNKQPDKAAYVEFAAKYAAEYGSTTEEAIGILPEPTGATYDAFMILKYLLDQSGGDTDGDVLRDLIVKMPPYEGVAGKEGSTISWADSTYGFSSAMATLYYNPETGLLETVE